MSMFKDAGLYESRREHDACGVGAVVNISGKASHDIVAKANQILLNLHHRGAASADEITGDGAGILMQIPDEFLRDEFEIFDDYLRVITTGKCARVESCQRKSQ